MIISLLSSSSFFIKFWIKFFSLSKFVCLGVFPSLLSSLIRSFFYSFFSKSTICDVLRSTISFGQESPRQRPDRNCLLYFRWIKICLCLSKKIERCVDEISRLHTPNSLFELFFFSAPRDCQRLFDNLSLFSGIDNVCSSIYGQWVGRLGSEGPQFLLFPNQHWENQGEK